MTGQARRLAAAIAIIAWGAIAAQLLLNLGDAPAKGIPPWRVPIDLYGYFTIWSNTLVAMITTRAARGGDDRGLFGRPWLLAATVVYIIVVGLIYNLLLAGLNPQTGLRKLIDTIFHTIVPIAYPLWWLVCVPRGRLGWQALWPTLVVPILYGLVATSKGAVTGKYAYFFIDVGKYGWPQVLLNIAGLALLYAALMALVIAFDRRAGGATAPDPAA
jgi:hypothetical protein